MTATPKTSNSFSSQALRHYRTAGFLSLDYFGSGCILQTSSWILCPTFYYLVIFRCLHYVKFPNFTPERDDLHLSLTVPNKYEQLTQFLFYFCSSKRRTHHFIGITKLRLWLGSCAQPLLHALCDNDIYRSNCFGGTVSARHHFRIELS